MFRKTKIGVSADKQKYLSAINGKRLVILLDDVNTLDENSSVGKFFRNVLNQGYYYDHITMEKVHLKNVSIIAAESSLHEFTLSYEFVKHFKPISLPAVSVRSISDCYVNYIKSDNAEDVCHAVASLFEFATIG